MSEDDKSENSVHSPFKVHSMNEDAENPVRCPFKEADSWL